MLNLDVNNFKNTAAFKLFLQDQTEGKEGEALVPAPYFGFKQTETKAKLLNEISHFIKDAKDLGYINLSNQSDAALVRKFKARARILPQPIVSNTNLITGGLLVSCIAASLVKYSMLNNSTSNSDVSVDPLQNQVLTNNTGLNTTGSLHQEIELVALDCLHNLTANNASSHLLQNAFNVSQSEITEGYLPENISNFLSSAVLIFCDPLVSLYNKMSLWANGGASSSMPIHTNITKGNITAVSLLNTSLTDDNGLSANKSLHQETVQSGLNATHTEILANNPKPDTQRKRTVSKDEREALQKAFKDAAAKLDGSAKVEDLQKPVEISQGQ